MGIKIIGTGKYLPERIVTNQELASMMDTSDEWIRTRTGIEERRVVSTETTHFMGAEAARGAIALAGVNPEDIDLVIVSTVTPDYFTPSAACLIANELKLSGAPACFDINAACAGFVFALNTARLYLELGERKTALVVSSEMLTKITDYEDRATCILFGDGAGAVVVQADSTKMYANCLGSDPAGSSKLFARAILPSNPFMEHPFDPLSDGLPETRGKYLYQDGKEVYKFATRILPRVVQDACEKAGITVDDLALIVPHQANRRILETAAKHLGISIDKMFINIEKYGNSSSACMPICLCEAVAEGKLKRGDKFCLVGFGGGLVYGATVLEY